MRVLDIEGLDKGYVRVPIIYVRETERCNSDWKLAKPKMHIWSMGDPAPDSADFKQDVICEHDELSLKTISRRLISVQVSIFVPFHLTPDANIWLGM